VILKYYCAYEAILISVSLLRGEVSRMHLLASFKILKYIFVTLSYWLDLCDQQR